MGKNPKINITVNKEPYKVIIMKDKLGKTIWWKTVPTSEDNKIRKCPHYINGKPFNHHYDIHTGKKDMNIDDNSLKNRAPGTIIITNSKEIFLTERCDEAAQILFYTMLDNPQLFNYLLNKT